MSKPTPKPKSNILSNRLFVNVATLVAVILIAMIMAHFLLRIGTRHGSRRTVPQFTGLLLNEAEQLAKENDLKIHINDSLYVPTYEGGTVLDQLPADGVEVKPGRTVYITINAFGDRMVEVPYVAGRSLRQAKNMLELSGLEIDKLVYVHDMATNYVLAEYVGDKKVTDNTKHEVVIGSGVTLHVGVSSNDPTTAVPNLVGLTLHEAKSRLWESGLNIGTISKDKGVDFENQKQARVYKQTRYAGGSAGWGSSVGFTLTMDVAKVDKAM